MPVFRRTSRGEPVTVTIYNVDGSEMARWDADLCYPPGFQNRPNHDARCPYGISIDSGMRHDLATGVPLNHAIRLAVKELTRGR
jgi:hypothetical protein